MNKNNEKNVYLLNNFNSTNVGGAEEFSRTISLGLIQRGYSVTWCYPDTSNSRLDNINSLPNDIKTRQINMVHVPHLSRVPQIKAVTSLVHDISHQKNSILVVNGLFAYSFPILTALQLCHSQTKVVHIFHGVVPSLDVFKDRSGLQQKLALPLTIGRKLAYSKVLNHRNVTNIAVSNYVAKSAQKQIGLNNIDVYYPPSKIDNCQAKVKSPDKEIYNITGVSRFSPEKGLDLFAQIAIAAHENNLRFNFMLVGGASNEKYQKYIESKMSGYVSLPGIRLGTELCKSYTNADIGLFTSPEEGFGLVTIEHLAHANPVIATNNGATREIFSGLLNESGVLVSNTNNDIAIQNTLEFLAQYQINSDLRHRMSESALNSSEKFNSQQLTSKFVDGILQN